MKKLMFLLLLVGCYQDKPSYEFQYSIVLKDGKTEQKSYLYHEDDTWAGVYIDPNHDETITVEIE